VETDDPSALGSAAVALAPWVVQNIQMALDRPTPDQDELTGHLINALAAMPRGHMSPDAAGERASSFSDFQILPSATVRCLSVM
jgi:hypothetical protein